MPEQPNEGEQPYVVTRGQPPREYQFKPGQSGNPKGRPKGSKDMAAISEEELDRKIEVTVSGKLTKMTKRQVMIRQLVDKALKGDIKAFMVLRTLQNEKRGSTSDAVAEIIAEDMEAIISADEQVLRSYIARQAGEAHDG